MQASPNIVERRRASLSTCRSERRREHCTGRIENLSLDWIRLGLAKGEQLRRTLLVHPAFHAMLGHLRSRYLDKFKNDLEQSLKSGKGFAASACSCTQSCMLEFDQGCTDVVIKQADWDTSKVQEKLRRDIEAHALSVRSAKLSELSTDYEKQLTEVLSEPVGSLFDAAGRDTWASIRDLYRKETETALSGFSSSLSGFELDQVSSDTMLVNLKDYARSLVEKKAREEATKVLIHMKDRFATVFSQDKESMPRVWTGKENIRKITKEAHAAALKLLAVMATIRLDEKSDKIENILNSALNVAPVARGRGAAANTDPLASSSWEEVSPKDTLITPVQCKSLWRQFKAETEYTVTQAISAQEAHKRSNSWLPPPWAIIALGLLGFNEFMVLLRNPLYLGLIFVLFLLSRALWVQLGIAGEFRNGALLGILSISSKFVPTVMNLLRQLAEAGQETHEAPRAPEPALNTLNMGQENHEAPQAPQPSPPLNTQSFRSEFQRQPTSVILTPGSSSSSTISSPKNGNKYTSPLEKSYVGGVDTDASSTS